MAKTNAVWGIDIGQCALKALRCRPNDDATRDHGRRIRLHRVSARFSASPRPTRSSWCARRSSSSCRAIRCAATAWRFPFPGQSGLARFIKLPPVESKKIPDIVKYEARQQIPFALEDVVWDYQQMAGGSEEDGFALETEVGLFAMKRDQVYRALKPFEEAGIEVDIIQLTPLAIYNYTVFDQMQDLPPADEYDPDNPPESVVVLSLGTDTTDLVITNGYRVWQRSVPLGGSHFTKALSKELRLTFAKAEHLKRNAMQAEDRGAVFQAMRPVFNDLLTEVQRSIGFFTNIDRNAKIGRVIALGNAMKLPGLQKYLSQNLGYPVAEVRSLSRAERLGGRRRRRPSKKTCSASPSATGWCCKRWARRKLSTNLLPREIVTDRLIRDKKPWAVALVAALLLGCAVSFLGHWRAWNGVARLVSTRRFGKAMPFRAIPTALQTSYEVALKTFKDVDRMGKSIVMGTNIAGEEGNRIQWMQVLKAIDECLPQNTIGKEGKDERPAGERGAEIPIGQRDEIHIDQLEIEFTNDLKLSWYDQVKDKIKATNAPKPKAGLQMPPVGSEGAAAEGPSGEGWIIQIRGHHFHNDDDARRDEKDGAEYVRKTFMKAFSERQVQLPTGKGQEPVKKALKDIGLVYPPVLVEVGRVNETAIVISEETGDVSVPVRNFEFTLQFCWQKKTTTRPPKTEAY